MAEEKVTEVSEKKETSKKAEAPVKKTGVFKGVTAEFKKIIWPTTATVARETGAVVFFGVLLGVLIALVDALIKAGLGLIL